jgi:hypothetical protein
MVSSVNLEDKKEYGFLAQLVAFTYRRYISAGTMLITYCERTSAERVRRCSLSTTYPSVLISNRERCKLLADGGVRCGAHCNSQRLAAVDYVAESPPYP